MTGVDNQFGAYANEKKAKSRKSVSLISCICLIQAIDIEDVAVYIIMVMVNRSILTDNYFQAQGVSDL